MTTETPMTASNTAIVLATTIRNVDDDGKIDGKSCLTDDSDHLRPAKLFTDSKDTSNEAHNYDNDKYSNEYQRKKKEGSQWVIEDCLLINKLQGERSAGTALIKRRRPELFTMAKNNRRGSR